MLQDSYIIFQNSVDIWDSAQNMLNFGLRCSFPAQKNLLYVLQIFESFWSFHLIWCIKGRVRLLMPLLETSKLLYACTIFFSFLDLGLFE